MRIPAENLSIFHSVTAENASRTSEREGSRARREVLGDRVTNEHAPTWKQQKEQVSKTVLILAQF